MTLHLHTHCLLTASFETGRATIRTALYGHSFLNLLSIYLKINVCYEVVLFVFLYMAPINFEPNFMKIGIYR
jgi:hypothetical protein